VIPADLPDYVERGGRQVWRPPYRARQAEIYGFVVAADADAIDAVLQRDLVVPAGGAVDYRCAHPHVVLTFAAIGQLASGDPVDELRGYLPERELSVWCLAADATTSPSRLVWYLPYVFTDSGQTVATGREVYGYPKQIGHFEAGYPGTLANQGTTTVGALAIDPFSPASAAAPRPMVSAERLAGAAAPVRTAATLLDELALVFPGGPQPSSTLPFGPPPQPSAVITPAAAPPPPGPQPVAPWVKPILDALEGRALSGDPADLIVDVVNNPTLVFLKQFRDVRCPTKACYQAIVEAPLSFDLLGATYTPLDPSQFAIAVEEWASHPIASDLGVQARTPLAPELAFHATVDFDIRLGQEVWRAPT
jgi:hypothetical protein